MALTTVILVRETKNWLPDIVEKAKKLTVGPGHENCDIAPLNHKELYDRVHTILGTVEKEGGKLILDGRNYKVNNHPNGLFVGPTVIDNVLIKLRNYIFCLFRLLKKWHVIKKKYLDQFSVLCMQIHWTKLFR